MEKKEEKKKPSGSFSEVWEKRGQETDAANDFRKKIEMEITEARPGYAVGEIVLKPWHMNILGIVHGGVLYSLADTVGLRSPDRGWHDPLSESWKKHIQNHRPGAGNTEWLCIFGVRMQDL
mgnify:CR=1 FL=1